MRACLLLTLVPLAAAAQSPSWAAVGVPTSGETVIASSSKKVEPSIPREPRLPPPDDGLSRQTVAVPEGPRQGPLELLSRPAPSMIQPVSATEPTHTGLGVEIRSPDRILQGQAVSCEITARNGVSPVVSARVELPLPPGTRVVTSDPPARRGEGSLIWDLGDLPAGAERALRAEVLPPESEEIGLRPVVSYEPAAGTKTAILLAPVGVVLAAPESVTVGDAVPFKITLKNNTPSTLRRVALSCRLPDGMLHAQGQSISADLAGDLPPGQERVEELSVRTGTSGSKALVLEVRADGGLIASARAVVEVKPPVVSLQLQGPRRARVGEDFAVRLLVANPGRSATVPLHVFLPLPEGVEFVSAGDGGGMHPSGGCLCWTVEPLAAEGYRAVNAALRGRAGGDWALTGVVTADGLREGRHTLAVLVEHTPNLTIDLTRLDDPLEAGGETTYSVRVYNPGPGETKNVQPHFDLPEHLLAVQGEGPTRWQISGQRIVFEPLASVPARMDATFAVRVRAVRPGDGPFRASVSATGLAGAMTREVTARVK